MGSLSCSILLLNLQILVIIFYILFNSKNFYKNLFQIYSVLSFVFHKNIFQICSRLTRSQQVTQRDYTTAAGSLSVRILTVYPAEFRNIYLILFRNLNFINKIWGAEFLLFTVPVHGPCPSPEPEPPQGVGVDPDIQNPESRNPEPEPLILRAEFIQINSRFQSHRIREKTFLFLVLVKINLNDK